MIFAIDIGATTVKTALMDGQGGLHAVQAFALDPRLGIAGIAEPLGAIFAKHDEEARSTGDADREIRAVGIGSRGIVDTENAKLIEDTGVLDFFAGHSFRELLAVDLPMGVENDAVAATLGENRFGIGRETRNFLLLTLGTFVGGGIIIDGVIDKGHSGMAGHLGHMPLNPDGIRCGCGNVGCLETEFSASALTRKFEASNAERAGGDPVRDVPHLIDLAKKGDARARSILEESVGYLARGISGYANAFDPEKLVLSGGLTLAGPYLLDMIHHALDPILWRKSPREFVVFSHLGAQTGLYGAGAVGVVALEASKK